jgi:hypothetical protein
MATHYYAVSWDQLHRDARALADWFERISETAQNYWTLERAVTDASGP